MLSSTRFVSLVQTLTLQVCVTFIIILSASGNIIGQNADIRLLDKFNNADRSSATCKSFKFITDANTPICLAIPVGLLAAGIIDDNRNMKLKAAYMLESIVVAEGITFFLKYSIDRPRPFGTYPYIIQKSSGGSPSFPSGHTSFAFSMATSVSIAYPRWYIIAPSALFASAVGYSRMYLGVHYPSDVLAGALLGSGSAYIAYKVNRWMHRPGKKTLSVTWN